MLLKCCFEGGFENFDDGSFVWLVGFWIEEVKLVVGLGCRCFGEFVFGVINDIGFWFVCLIYFEVGMVIDRLYFDFIVCFF